MSEKNDGDLPALLESLEKHVAAYVMSPFYNNPSNIYNDLEQEILNIKREILNLADRRENEAYDVGYENGFLDGLESAR